MRLKLILFSLLVVLIGATTVPALNYLTKTISLEGKCPQRDCAMYSVKLDYPEFTNVANRRPIDSLNAFVKGVCDEECNKFLSEVQDYFGTDSQRFGSQRSTLVNQLQVKYATEEFVSIFLTFQYAYPGEDNLHLHDDYYLNFRLDSGQSLHVADCFQFKKSPEDWARFVQEEEFLVLGPGEEMPVEFTLTDWGVDFLFPRSDVSHSFQWEVVADYFVIGEQIPKSLYEGASSN